MIYPFEVPSLEAPEFKNDSLTIAGFADAVVDTVRKLGGHRLAIDALVTNNLPAHMEVWGAQQLPDDSIQFKQIPHGETLDRVDAVLLDYNGDGIIDGGARLPSSAVLVPEYELYLSSGGAEIARENPAAIVATDATRLAQIPASAYFIPIAEFKALFPYFVKD